MSSSMHCMRWHHLQKLLYLLKINDGATLARAIAWYIIAIPVPPRAWDSVSFHDLLSLYLLPLMTPTLVSSRALATITLHSIESFFI